MGRKVIDTYPVFTVSVGSPKGESWSMTREQAEEAQAEFLELLDGLKAYTRRQFDVESKLIEDARCEHCNSTWTEASPDFNGACCSKDEANDPERLKELRALAEKVYFADLHRSDDQEGRRRQHQFSDFAGKVVAWLDGGRPAESAADLLNLADVVDGHEWGTLWTDPGDYPNSLASGPLPDRWSVDTDPNELADQVRRLIDDMGLLPARKVA